MRLGHQTRRMLTRLVGRACDRCARPQRLDRRGPVRDADRRPDSTAGSGPAPVPAVRAVLDTYCITCHNQRLHTAGLALDTLDVTNPGANAEVWEKVIAKLRAGSMPPPGRPRPDAATYRAVASALENDIDRAWAASPNPGRIDAVHRLNRAEYNNAIRDLFALDIDVKSLLPGDETADGSFDNFADFALDFDGPSGTVHVGGPSGHAARDRPSSRTADDRDVRDSVARRAGRSAERGSAVRVSRRHRDSPRLSGRRRVPHQSSSAAAVSGLPQRHGMAAAARRPSRRQAAETVHRRRRRARQARRDQLCRRRRAELCRRSRMGKVHADRRRRGSGAPRPGAGGTARGRRVVREGTVGTGRPAAAAAAGQGHHERPGVHGLRERGLGPDRRPLQNGRTGERHAEPPRDFRLPAQGGCRRAGLRHEDPFTDGPARVSPAGDEPDVQTLLEFFDNGRRDGGSFDAGIQFALERMLVDPGLPSARPSGSGRAEAVAERRIASTIIERGLALVVLPLEQHPRRSPARAGRARTADEPGDRSKTKCGECWPIRAPPMRSSTISPRSG